MDNIGKKLKKTSQESDKLIRYNKEKLKELTGQSIVRYYTQGLFDEKGNLI